MKKEILLFVKGFLIGIANIIPGVSGGTLAVSFGIYEKLINIASNITKDIKESIKFVLPIIIGAGLAILVLSNIITFCLETYKLATPLFFIGLILGGLSLIFKKVKGSLNETKNIVSFIATVIFLIIFSLTLKVENNISLENINIMGYILLFIVGSIASATMVIPGISGSFVLMAIGYYKPIVHTISELTKFNNIISNVLILVPFGIGVIIGLILVSKAIKICLEKWKEQTFMSILAFVLYSILIIVIPLFEVKIDIMELIIGIILLIIGALISLKLEK